MKRLGDVDVVQERLGNVHRATIRRWEREGAIPRSIRLGTGNTAKKLWDLDEIDEAVERQLALRPER